MAAALRTVPAILILAALAGCTLWTSDFDRIVDQTGRDFKIDPDKHYRSVDLADVIAHPSSYKLLDVRFQAIIDRHDESIFTPLYSTFRQEDYTSFSVWPAAAPLWIPATRRQSIPFLFMRKDNPYFQNMVDAKHYSLVDIRGKVMGDYDQKPWIDVLYVDEVTPVLYTDQSLTDYREGMEAYSQNVPATAVLKLELALKEPLAPKLQVEAHLALGKIYEGRGEFARAAYHYDQVLNVDEKNEVAWDGLERAQKQIKPTQKEAPQPRKRTW